MSLVFTVCGVGSGGLPPKVPERSMKSEMTADLLEAGLACLSFVDMTDGKNCNSLCRGVLM